MSEIPRKTRLEHVHVSLYPWWGWLGRRQPKNASQSSTSSSGRRVRWRWRIQRMEKGIHACNILRIINLFLTHIFSHLGLVCWNFQLGTRPRKDEQRDSSLKRRSNGSWFDEIGGWNLFQWWRRQKTHQSSFQRRFSWILPHLFNSRTRIFRT